VLVASSILLVGRAFDAHPDTAHAQCDTGAWHPPACGHEHGDDAPGWVKDWLVKLGLPPQIRFDGPNTTGPHENVEKHPAFKGYYAPTGFKSFNQEQPVEIYVLMHASSNPGDRQAPVHSSFLFVKDAAGNVSFRQGWQKLGHVKLSTACQAPRLPTCETPEIDNAQRPIILAPTDAGLAGQRSQETWYGDSSFDISWGVSDATTKLTPNERLSYNPADWFPTGFSGLRRTLDVTWQVTPQTAKGWQVRDQFGTEILGVSSTPALDDYSGLAALQHPRCSQTTVYDGVTYPVLCLAQYIAQTTDGVVTRGGAQRTFAGPSDGPVRLPN
jgi:hypothetical protein